MILPQGAEHTLVVLESELAVRVVTESGRLLDAGDTRMMRMCRYSLVLTTRSIGDQHAVKATGGDTYRQATREGRWRSWRQRIYRLYVLRGGVVAAGVLQRYAYSEAVVASIAAERLPAHFNRRRRAPCSWKA